MTRGTCQAAVVHPAEKETGRHFDSLKLAH
jgi:hypothetical protein